MGNRDVINSMNIGELIKLYRKKAGLTQKDLSNKLNYKDNHIISLYETGKKSPQIKALVDIANVLNIDLSYLKLDKKVTPLNLNYIPTGFEKVEDYGDTYLYRKNNKFFTVQKCELSAIVDFDTEKYERENIKINGADAVYFRTNDELNGVIFNNGKYIFIVNGNISKDDIVNIAQNAE